MLIASLLQTCLYSRDAAIVVTCWQSCSNIWAPNSHNAWLFSINKWPSFCADHLSLAIVSGAKESRLTWTANPSLKSALTFCKMTTNFYASTLSRCTRQPFENPHRGQTGRTKSINDRGCLAFERRWTGPPDEIESPDIDHGQDREQGRAQIQ